MVFHSFGFWLKLADFRLRVLNWSWFEVAMMNCATLLWNSYTLYSNTLSFVTLDMGILVVYLPASWILFQNRHKYRLPAHLRIKKNFPNKFLGFFCRWLSFFLHHARLHQIEELHFGVPVAVADDDVLNTIELIVLSKSVRPMWDTEHAIRQR